MNDKADEIIEEHFESLENRYQNNLESMKVVSLSSIMFNYCNKNVKKRNNKSHQ